MEHLLGKVRKGRELEPEQIETILVGSSNNNKEAEPAERRTAANGEPGGEEFHIKLMAAVASGTAPDCCSLSCK